MFLMRRSLLGLSAAQRYSSEDDVGHAVPNLQSHQTQVRITSK
jgi:hypothetical protein